MSVAAPNPEAPNTKKATRELSTRQNLAIAAGVIGFAAILPLFFDSGGTMLNIMVLSTAYVVMALGLNIIVGFAGLLDLGFVAFFAIGAYVMGWFGSLFFAEINGEKGIHILTAGRASELPGIHMNFILVLVCAVIAKRRSRDPLPDTGTVSPHPVTAS